MNNNNQVIFNSWRGTAPESDRKNVSSLEPSPRSQSIDEVLEDMEDVEDQPQPEVAKIRRRVVPSRDGRYRSKTIAPKRLTAEEKRLALTLAYPDDVERPKTRADCQSMPRPCPFVSCEHHLYLDVNPHSGSLKLSFPHLEVWEMADTCALDVADRGGITLEEVAAILGLTRERIRQVEVRGLTKLQTRSEEDVTRTTSSTSQESRNVR